VELVEVGDELLQEDVLDILEDGIVDDEFMEYCIPWTLEEEIETSSPAPTNPIVSSE